MTTESIQERCEEQYNDCQLSELYHEQREAFLNGCHRLSMLLVIISNSVLANVGQEYVETTLGKWGFILILLPSIIAGISLVFNLAVAAQRHNFLRFRYAKLSSDFQDYNITEEKLALLVQEKTKLYAEEPPAYRMLLCICTNHLNARVGDTRRIKIPLFKGGTRNFFRWAGHIPVVEDCTEANTLGHKEANNISTP